MNRYPYIQPTESRWAMPQFLISVALAGTALGLYAVGFSLDEKADKQMQALARAERARLTLPADLQVAYERGLADAAQACVAGEVLP